MIQISVLYNWCLNSSPRPHAFVGLSVQSKIIDFSVISICKKITVNNLIVLFFTISIVWCVRYGLNYICGLENYILLDSFIIGVSGWFSSKYTRFIAEQLVEKYSNVFMMQGDTASNIATGKANTDLVNSNTQSSGSASKDPNLEKESKSPISDTSEDTPMSPDTFTKEKQKFMESEAEWKPAPHLLEVIKPNANEILQMRKDWVETFKPEGIWLERVENYFKSLDKNMQASDSDKEAFEKRKQRYLGWMADKDSWKGPPIDFENADNVRRVAQDDLKQYKFSLAESELFIKNYKSEDFKGADGKQKFERWVYQLESKLKKDKPQLFKDVENVKKARLDSMTQREFLEFKRIQLSYRQDVTKQATALYDKLKNEKK